MPEYLTKEEIKQWRSSLEKITLEEFAARLGKTIETEKPISCDGEKISIQCGGSAAARVDDTVEVEIPAQTVVVAVSGGSGAPAVGTMNIKPIKLQGKITSGSKTVEIG